MSVLVTGAEGFVGRRLVEMMREAGHEVVAAVRPGMTPPPEVRVVPLELTDAASVAAAVREAGGGAVDAVVHLAGISSVAQSLTDPGMTWAINAAGTARLMAELGARRLAGDADPLVLLVSSAEVYDASIRRPLVETDALKPRSPYAASKLGAEWAGLETATRTGLKVVIARSFPHTGPGQDQRFALPSFARRLLIAKRAGARVIKVGNLEPVRELLDVRDVARAYLAILGCRAAIAPGEVFNVAAGRGWTMADLLARLAAVAQVDVIPEVDAALVRPSDVPYLVGDATKLKRATGWEPRIALEQTLTDLVHAQAD